MALTVSINGAPIMMEVDTGATLSIMSYSTYLASWPKRHQTELKSSEAKLRTYTGEEIAVTGVSDVTIKYHNKEVNLIITVVGGDGPTLLGRDRGRTCGLIGRPLTTSHKLNVVS